MLAPNVLVSWCALQFIDAAERDSLILVPRCFRRAPSIAPLYGDISIAGLVLYFRRRIEFYSWKIYGPILLLVP